MIIILDSGEVLEIIKSHYQAEMGVEVDGVEFLTTGGVKVVDVTVEITGKPIAILRSEEEG